MSIADIVEEIRSGVHAETIEAIRHGRAELKLELPAFTPSELGLVCLDFDDQPRVSELFKAVCLMPSTVVAFISPGGQGVKVLVRVSPIPAEAEWEHAFDEAARVYRHLAKTDPAGRPRWWRCSLSWDPFAYYNPSAERIRWRPPPNPRE